YNVQPVATVVVAVTSLQQQAKPGAVVQLRKLPLPLGQLSRLKIIVQLPPARPTSLPTQKPAQVTRLLPPLLRRTIQLSQLGIAAVIVVVINKTI
ncbi:unnamed protein product, partial [Rotaria sp. Silwood2]